MLRALPYPESSRLVRLLEQFPDGVGSIAYPNFVDWKAQQNSFDKLAAWKTTDAPLTGADTPIQMRVAEVTGEFFDALKIRTVLGRFLEPDDDKVGAPPLIVLRETLWKSRFGSDSQIIGKTVQLAVALFASFIPARKAARIVALRVKGGANQQFRELTFDFIFTNSTRL